MEQELFSHIDRELNRVIDDHTSGAQALTVISGRILIDIINRFPDDMTEETAHESIVKMCRRIVREQPSIASLRQMMKGLLHHIEDIVTLSDLKIQSVRFIEQHLDWLRDIKFRIARLAAPLFANKSKILTHSLSTIVFETFREAVKINNSFEVYATESRPFYEGRLLAKQLTEFGIPVTLILDAAASNYVEKSDLVILGADRITQSDVINKIGSLPIVLASQNHNIPCYILAGSDKYLSEDEEPVTLSNGLDSDVWEGAPSGIKMENPFFEKVPVRSVTGIITENGIVPYGQFAQQRGFRLK